MLRIFTTFADLIKVLLGAIFGAIGWTIDLFRERDHAAEADAAASQVRQETERILAAEPEPEARYDLATTTREFLAGSRIDIDHLPPRQKFGLLAFKEKGIDASMISDADLEAYVRGDHRARDLPDIVDRRWLADASDGYVQAMRSAHHVVDDEPEIALGYGR